MDFMNGMVLLQQEMSRQKRRRERDEWSLSGSPQRLNRGHGHAGPAAQGDCRPVRQSDRRSGPRRLLAFVLRRPEVAVATEIGSKWR